MLKSSVFQARDNATCIFTSFLQPFTQSRVRPRRGAAAHSFNQYNALETMLFSFNPFFAFHSPA